MKNLKTYVAAVTLLLGLGGAMVIPASVAMASPQSTVCSTLGSAADCSTTPSNGIDLNGVIGAVVNILSIVVGILAVIMIIFGGFRYITSAGDSGKITNAKNTIIYALVGLIIVVLAQAIVRFVLFKVT
jgi:hypothetical protein